LISLKFYSHSAYNLLTHNTTAAESFIPSIPQLANYSARILERVSTQGRYEPQLLRQAADLKDFEADEELVLDDGIDYESVVGLSEEVKERLKFVRPTTIVSFFFRLNK
jgi:tRNA uridine 5-carboxymethylaminomethyl modification enzyme